MKYAFDLGGTVTKYPEIFHCMIVSLQSSGWNQVFILTDMKDRANVRELMKLNGLEHHVLDSQIHLADYDRHGEACKAIVMRDLGIDVLVDDHGGYLVWPWPEPAPLRLLVTPDPRRPYTAPTWKTPDGEGFGRTAFVEGGGAR